MKGREIRLETRISGICHSRKTMIGRNEREQGGSDLRAVGIKVKFKNCKEKV